MSDYMGYRPAIRTAEEIKKIEKACRIVADTLSLVAKMVEPGITTKELDEAAEDYIRSKNGRPAFKGYKVGNKYFPSTLCVSIDCGCELDGYYGDSALTVAVGEISDEKKRLMKVTEESLYKGLEQAVDKNKLYDISKAIQEHCESNGYSLTRELTGHGIGEQLHEPPSIPNFVPPLLHRSNFPNIKLKSGMALAIEPMVHLGAKEVVTLEDGWTVVTKDRSPAAHFEHTIVVQENKPLILTLR
jgi:methionyl aminopeptidase